jgi:hypothetical protein
VTTSVDSWCYVFGVVPAGTAPPTLDADAVSGPAADLRVIEVGEIAALVGTPPADRPLGRASDLAAHDRVLAAAVRDGTAVLPMRFGAVISDDTAVADELLAANHDRFRDALQRVEGRVQYTVKVRYDEDAVLREVLAANPDIAALRRSGDARRGFEADLQLGERVVRALERLAPGDADAVVAALQRFGQVRRRATSAPEDVLHAAFLVEASSSDDFEQQVEALGAQQADRLRIRLIGPSAAYDFVEDE